MQYIKRNHKDSLWYFILAHWIFLQWCFFFFCTKQHFISKSYGWTAKYDFVAHHQYTYCIDGCSTVLKFNQQVSTQEESVPAQVCLCVCVCVCLYSPCKTSSGPSKSQPLPPSHRGLGWTSQSNTVQCTRERERENEYVVMKCLQRLFTDGTKTSKC